MESAPVKLMVMKVPELHDAPLLQCFFCSQDTPKVVPTCKKHTAYLLLIWNGTVVSLRLQ